MGYVQACGDPWDHTSGEDGRAAGETLFSVSAYWQTARQDQRDTHFWPSCRQILIFPRIISCKVLYWLYTAVFSAVCEICHFCCCQLAPSHATLLSDSWLLKGWSSNIIFIFVLGLWCVLFVLRQKVPDHTHFIELLTHMTVKLNLTLMRPWHFLLLHQEADIFGF